MLTDVSALLRIQKQDATPNPQAKYFQDVPDAHPIHRLVPPSLLEMRNLVGHVEIQELPADVHALQCLPDQRVLCGETWTSGSHKQIHHTPKTDSARERPRNSLSDVLQRQLNFDYLAEGFPVHQPEVIRGGGNDAEDPLLWRREADEPQERL